MMRLFIGAFFLTIFLVPKDLQAFDELLLSKFVNENVIEQNYKNFGLNSLKELESLGFGESIEIDLITKETIENESNGAFSSKTEERFVPVLINSEIKFFLVIDKNDVPVSMGYKVLAYELNKISGKFSAEISDIKIYKNLDINSFLFSVSTYRDPNLTILSKDWDKQRAGLTPLRETLSFLSDHVKGDK